jgi:hypothetical protein
MAFDSTGVPLSEVNNPTPSYPYRPQPIKVVEGEKPPIHPEYHKLCREWDFYESSWKGGSRYKDARDENGLPVLVQHSSESKQGFESRKSLSSYNNFPRAVIDRMTSLIFSRPIKRDPNEKFSEWCENVDGNKTCMHIFMHDRMVKAATLGIWGMVIDSNIIDPPTSKLSEDETAKIYIRDIDPRSCINWSKDRKIVLLKQPDQIQLVDDTNVTTWKLDEDGNVLATPMVVSHGWEYNPIIWLYGCAAQEGPEASLIGDVSTHSKLLFNYKSWLMEESQKATFSTFVVTAPNLDPSKMAMVPLGSRNWLLFPCVATDIRWECIGSDPAQAASLRDSIEKEIDQIYQSVGLQRSEAIRSSAESGVAIQIRLSEMSSNASRLAENAEQAENKILELWSTATGVEVEETCYPDPDDMDTGSLADDLKQALDVVSANMPEVLKGTMVRHFAEKKFDNMDKAEKDELVKAITLYYSEEAKAERDQAKMDQIQEAKPEGPKVKPDGQSEK